MLGRSHLILLRAQGILNVAAEEKKTGNKHKITITNDMGRLSKEQIEKMIADAKANEEIDRQAKERISAKNGLENYVYGVRNSLNEDKLKDAFSSADRTTIEKVVSETQKWMDSNEHAEKHEYEAKQKEVEAVCMPIMQKAYKAGGGSAGGHSAGGDSQQQRSGSGPTVDEVD